jgi:single-strand DNA-binding protein
MNQVLLIGRLTRDPELAYGKSGTAIATFTLAVGRKFKRDETDFINCKCFTKLAENVANFQQKGNMLGVAGRMQTGNYEKDGRKVYFTEVICDEVEFLTPKGGKPDSDDRWAHLEKEVSLDDVQLVDEADEDPIPF